MRAALAVLILCLTGNSLLAQSAGLKISINPSRVLNQITPEYWGANFLYWIDDDSSLADGQISRDLKEARLGLLRYPGGTVADNFHWRTARLENTNMFPFESGPAETDFDEFMLQCKKIGAEPALVVNVETWAVKGDVKGGAHEAAEWVRYCKQKGYKVRFWEIGNETYWHPVLSASEYADLINVYADSMRSIDPKIILGINGHWNVNFVGSKERIPEADLKQILELRHHINSPKEADDYHDLAKSKTRMPITNGTDKWWEILAAKCGSKIDMIIVHWYFNPRQLGAVRARLTEVDQLFKKKHPGKNFLMFMSEYNVNEKAPTSFQDLTEMQGEMLQAGVDLMAIWPMRMKYRKPTLIDYQTGRRSQQWEIFKHLSDKLKGNIVEVTADKELYAFGSASGNHRTIVVSGKSLSGDTPVNINFDAASPDGAKCFIWRISGTEFNYNLKNETQSLNHHQLKLNISPKEVVVISY